jgi:HAE1 family hydrophobic/amphiphilic exporter-1
MSRLTRLSLANRAVVALVTVAIAVFGAVSLGSLKQELIPSLQIPTVAVVAASPGSSPDLVETQVTEPLEAALAGVAGVEEVSSTASAGLSTTTVMLRYGTDTGDAAQDVRRALDRAASTLPEDVDPQVITGSIDDLPVVQLAVTGGGTGDEVDPAFVATLNEQVLPRLSDIEGVREVSLTGTRDVLVTVDLDLAAAAAAGVSPADVTSVLEDYGVALPAGTVDDADRTLQVQVGTPLTSVDELRALPLAAGSGTVPLGDVAEVAEGAAEPTSFSRLDGAPALGIAITKTPAGNTVDVSHGVAEALDELAPVIGDGQVAVVFDQAPFIEESIHGLATEGGLGLLFAVVVILVFLVSVTSTLVSAVSIPLSLLVTFIGLQVSGYSLNILTLGAMTVAIGRVVDDSIVVIENIKRHLSYGTPKRAAILTGVGEVAGAITASTVTTVAVFLPIGLVGGMVGELFRPFALTVAIAMSASLLVALTIVPVLAFWFLRTRRGSADAAAEREAAERREREGRMPRGYLAVLRRAVAHPVWTVTAAVAVLGGTLALAPRLETNFLDSTGQDTVTVTQTFPAGTSLATQDAAAAEVEAQLVALDGVGTVQTTVGSGDGFAAFLGGGTPQATFALTVAGDADATAVQDAVRADVTAADGTTLTVAGGDAAYGSSTVDVIVQAPDAEVLADLAEQVEEVVRGTPGTTDVTNDLAASQPTVRVAVDRDAVAAAGLSETAVAGAVAQVLSPQPVGRLDLGDGPVDVLVRTGEGPETVDDLRALVLPGGVPLTAIASVDVVDVPTSVTRVDGQRAVTVAATPAGQDLGTLTSELQRAVDGLDVPEGATVTIGGVSADQADAFADLGLALLIAVAIVYVVMVATFRSLRQPFVLLVSVPFAATGALLGLLATSTALGVPALIGVLMLIGIVVTNAIVLIDLVNQYRRAGLPLDEAVTEGARHRLRPIVMTAAATICALLPMAFGLTGGGVFISRPLAIVVIGGLVSSTLLTLVLVPVLYTLTERRGERRRVERGLAYGADEGEPAAGHGRHAAEPTTPAASVEPGGQPAASAADQA